MIDISRETLIRLEDVRDHVPSSRRGKTLGKAVCFRWAKTGARGVVLETIKIGGARLTSLEAIERFVAAQNPGQTSATTADREAAARRAAAADRELRRRGV